MKVQFKKIEIAPNIDLLYKMELEAFCRPFDSPSVNTDELKLYLEDAFAYLGYDKKGKPISFFAYHRQEKGKIHLKLFGVLPAFQGKGVGKKMLEKIIALSKGNLLTARTNPKNVKALLLYLGYGFNIDRWFDDFWGDGEPRLLLKLNNK